MTAPTSTLAGPSGAPWRSALTLLGHRVDELVVDRLLDVHALDRHAGLAAVLHRRSRSRRWRRARGRRRASTIIGSLPPSSSATGVSVSAARAMTLRPVAVEPVNITKSTASISAVPVSAPPIATWSTFSGSPHSRMPVGQQERRQRRDLGRLEHDRVAGRQRRDRVAEVVGQRVVPRPDHADDADRPVADDELAAEHERVRRPDLLVGQVLRARAWPRSRARRRRRRARRAARPRTSCRSRRRSSGSRARRCRRATSASAAARGRGPRTRAPPTRAAPRARARRAPRTSSGDVTGTLRMTSPVAGFSTSMVSVPSAAARSWPYADASGFLAGGEPARSALRPAAGRARPSGSVLDRVDDVHAVGHLAEHRVLAVEPRRGLGGDDEELRAVRVRARRSPSRARRARPCAR